MDRNNRTRRRRPARAPRDPVKGIKLQFLCCSSAFIGSFVSGLASACKRIYYSTHGSDSDRDYIFYMPMVGDVVGLLAASLSAYIFGRRAALIITNILLFLPLAMVLSEVNPKWNFAAIVLLQAAVRHQAVAVSVYVAEIASPKWRGLFISLNVPLFVTGVMISEYLLPTRPSRVLATALSMGAIMLDFNQVPETPYWLALIDKRNEAEELFARLRHGTQFKDEAETTFNLAELDADDQENGLLWLLFDAEFFEPLTLVLCMNLAAESSCQLVFAAHNTLSEYFKYETVLVRDLSDSLPRDAIFLVPIVGTLLMLLVVRFVGRRYIYFVSLILSYGLLVGYMVLKDGDNGRRLMEHSCFLALHLGGRQIALIVPTELFPNVIRPFGVAANELFQVLCHVADFYFLQNDYLNISPYLLIRMLFMVIGLLLCLRFLPETKDLTLFETEELGRNLWSRVLLEEVGF